MGSRRHAVHFGNSEEEGQKEDERSLDLCFTDVATRNQGGTNRPAAISSGYVSGGDEDSNEAVLPEQGQPLTVNPPGAYARADDSTLPVGESISLHNYRFIPNFPQAPLTSLGLDDPLSRLLLEKANETTVCLETLYLPVLTAISSLMGKCRVYTYTKKNFSQPNVIWSVVDLPKGSRRGSIIEDIRKALRPVDALHQETYSGPLYGYNRQPGATELSQQLSASDGTFLCIAEDLVQLNDQVSSITRPPVSGIYRGSFRDPDDSRIHLAGFTEPGNLMGEKFRALHGCLLVCKSKRRNSTYDRIGLQVPEKRSLTKLFRKVYRNHHVDGMSPSHEYTLTKEAEKVFGKYYDCVENQIERLSANAGTDRSQEILNKASGHALRLAMPLQAAIDALNGVEPTFEIEEEVMKVAVKLVEKFEEQKLDILRIHSQP